MSKEAGMCERCAALEAERDQAREDYEEAEADRQTLEIACKCVTCGGHICAPMQCVFCIEHERVPDNMPARPVTTKLRARVAALEAALREAIERGFIGCVLDDPCGDCFACNTIRMLEPGA